MDATTGHAFAIILVSIDVQRVPTSVNIGVSSANHVPIFTDSHFILCGLQRTDYSA
jgi:hypothetical protein